MILFVFFDQSTIFVWSLCRAHHYRCNAIGMQNGENFDENDMAEKKNYRQETAAAATTATTAMMTTMSNKLIDGIFFLFLISTQWYESVYVTASYIHSSFFLWIHFEVSNLSLSTFQWVPIEIGACVFVCIHWLCLPN